MQHQTPQILGPWSDLTEGLTTKGGGDGQAKVHFFYQACIEFKFSITNPDNKLNTKSMEG
jgi:hypothetical protein